MNIILEKKTIINRKSNFLIYSIEKGETPYICYYMIKNINNYIGGKINPFSLTSYFNSFIFYCSYSHKVAL
jgi:hypothetical protein